LDDHPRNHAILAKDNNWRLSPAYDLTPSPTISQDTRDLAMACGTHGRIASKANIMSGHGRFLLREQEAVRIFETITGTVRREWRVAMRHAKVSQRDCERIARAFLYEGLFYGVGETER
jgi:serine/threonine-protein kinase HipA